MTTTKEYKLAQECWGRYQSGMTRGHQNFQQRAKKNERYYLGAGEQWETELKEELADQGRPWLEANLVKSTIDTIAGYQTQSRLDIAYKPRETDDQDLSDVLSKVSMHVLDQNMYPWTESEVFQDGMIQSRGYFDVRMDFDDNMYGNIKITSKDSLDIIPDPDGKTYDPDGWADVTETKWMSVDDIELYYGRKKSLAVLKTQPDEQDFGDLDEGEERNKFAHGWSGFSWTYDENRVPHVRVIERQWWKLQMREYLMDNRTGDLRPVPQEMTDKEKKELENTGEFTLVKRMAKRVRWTVCTQDTILHDDWSPYDHFTIIPYFPYFRRGRTIGIVDNMISMQEMLNKTLSQIQHVINTTANSGWLIEENSLVNMEPEELETYGGTSGLIVEYRSGREKPEKIQHNQIPTGLDSMANKAVDLISLISGVSDIFQGQKGNEVTGVAIQSRVQQNAVGLAAPIDNLFRTRHMLAKRILELVQNFYTEERIFVITVPNPETGMPENQQVVINQPQYEDDIVKYMNDTTQGSYDVIISDVPDQVSFQNAQFNQLIEMRKFGIEVPDDVLIQHSSISNKNEIVKRMQGQKDPEVAEMEKRMAELEMAEKEASIAKTKAEEIAKKLQATKDAIDSALSLSENPAAAPMAQQFADVAGLGEEEIEEEEGELPGQNLTPEEQNEMIAAQQAQAFGGEL